MASSKPLGRYLLLLAGLLWLAPGRPAPAEATRSKPASGTAAASPASEHEVTAAEETSDSAADASTDQPRKKGLLRFLRRKHSTQPETEEASSSEPTATEDTQVESPDPAAGVSTDQPRKKGLLRFLRREHSAQPETEEAETEPTDSARKETTRTQAAAGDEEASTAADTAEVADAAEEQAAEEPTKDGKRKWLRVPRIFKKKQPATEEEDSEAADTPQTETAEVEPAPAETESVDEAAEEAPQKEKKSIFRFLRRSKNQDADAPSEFAEAHPQGASVPRADVPPKTRKGADVETGLEDLPAGQDESTASENASKRKKGLLGLFHKGERPGDTESPTGGTGAPFQAYQDAKRMYEQGNYRGAAQQFAWFIQNDTMPYNALHAPAAYYRADCFRRLKQTEDAKEAFRQVTERYGAQEFWAKAAALDLADLEAPAIPAELLTPEKKLPTTESEPTTEKPAPGSTTSAEPRPKPKETTRPAPREETAPPEDSREKKPAVPTAKPKPKGEDEAAPEDAPVDAPTDAPEDAPKKTEKKPAPRETPKAMPEEGAAPDAAPTETP